MARNKDNPRDQAAKNFPGRRKTKTKRELAALEAMDKAAEREAAPIAAGKLQALPFFLGGRGRRHARAAWQALAPSLDRLHLLSMLERNALARYCVYFDEFVTADAEVRKKGYAIHSKSTKGHPRPWLNPSVSRRDYANEQMLRLESEFGMTPLARHNLIAKHIMRDDDETLFGRNRIRPTAPAPDTPTPSPPATRDDDEGFAIGGMSAFDTPSPGKPN